MYILSIYIYMKSNPEKPLRDWTEETVLSKLKVIAKGLGHFPIQAELRGNKEYTITNAITKLGLNYHDLAIKLGYPPNHKPRNYWIEDNIKKELQKIINEIGHFPGAQELYDMGQSGLRKAMAETHSINYYRKIFNARVSIKRNQNQIMEELKSLIDRLGYFPNSVELYKINNPLRSAMLSSGRKYRSYQEELGFIPKEKPKGYWQNFENLRKEVEPYIKNNILPPIAILQKNIQGDIQRTMSDFGGLHEVAKLMNCEVAPESFLIAKDGHALKSSYEIEFDNFLYEHNIAHEVDNPINENTKLRYDFKIADTFVEIWGFNERKNNKRCERYCQKRLKKEQFYADNNLKLISIEGKVFRRNKISRHQYFKQLLQEHNLIP